MSESEGSWICPRCGSEDLIVFWSVRLVSGLGLGPDPEPAEALGLSRGLRPAEGELDVAPASVYAGQEEWNFCCRACHGYGLEPEHA